MWFNRLRHGLAAKCTRFVLFLSLNRSFRFVSFRFVSSFRSHQTEFVGTKRNESLPYLGLCPDINRGGILQSGRVIYLFFSPRRGTGCSFSAPCPDRVSSGAKTP